MSRLTYRLRLLLRSLFHRKAVEQDLDSELHYHLECQIEDGVARGLPPEEARLAAMRELGAIVQSKEECRDMRGMNPLEDFLRDLRYGARQLRRNPAFSVVAVLVLAIGIGANTAMFSVAYGMLLRPLPYANAGRVAVVFMQFAPRDFAFGTMCIRDFLMWRSNNHAFEDPSLFRSVRMDIGGTEGVPEQVQGGSVTSGFFSALGVNPLIGRTFGAGDDAPATRSLTVLSESIWRRRFGGNPAVPGKTILVNGAPSTVIGVMPGDFRFPRRETEVWTNLPLNPPTRYGPWFYRGVARLKPGVTLRQAQAEVNNIGLRMMEENPDYKRLTMPVLSLRDAVLGITLKPAILVLTGAVGLVLLIAVVNVANLMLARTTVREREIALRISLGARRGRLVRQLLAESLLLAVMGGTAALALAWGGVALIRSWNPGNLPLIDAVRLDWSALAFMAVITMIAGILFGLAPALQSTRTELNAVIKESDRGGEAGPSRSRARGALVVAEIALSLVLLVGAGLLIRSFANLQRLSAGISVPPRQILTMLISPGNRKYKDPRAGLVFYDEVLRRARAVPGVVSAAITDSLPPDRQGDADTFQIEGQNLGVGELNPVVSRPVAGPDVFRTLGIPLIRGRDFNTHDTADSTPVAIVSEGFARRFFPNEDAIGKRIKQSGPGSDGPFLEIVGIVGDVKYLGLTLDTDPAYYMPFAQSYDPVAFLVVKSAGEAAGLAETMRRAIQSIDPDVTLAQTATMEQAMRLSVSQPRLDAVLLSLFAGIAVLLAAVGIYGLIAYSVARRTHEIGVRMALGAEGSRILRMVATQVASMAAIGIVLGLSGAFVLTRMLRTMLFGIGSTDAVTFAVAPLGIMLVVMLATFVPALRATRISPVVALRHE